MKKTDRARKLAKSLMDLVNHGPPPRGATLEGMIEIYTALIPKMHNVAKIVEELADHIDGQNKDIDKMTEWLVKFGPTNWVRQNFPEAYERVMERIRH